VWDALFSDVLLRILIPLSNDVGKGTKGYNGNSCKCKGIRWLLRGIAGRFVPAEEQRAMGLVG
jgi:hypothetical protein